MGDDIYAVIGTAIRNRVDVRAVVAQHFPDHDSFAAWRDAGHPHYAIILPTRDDLIEALLEIGLKRGARYDGSSEDVLQFDDHIEAERFRDWCRPE